MNPSASTTELRKMPPDELRREIRAKRALLAKTRMAIEMGSEKNHAAYRTMKREVARMTMVFEGMNPRSPKSPTNKTSSVSSPFAKATGDRSVSSGSSKEKPSKTLKKPVKRSSSK